MKKREQLPAGGPPKPSSNRTVAAAEAPSAIRDHKAGQFTISRDSLEPGRPAKSPSSLKAPKHLLAKPRMRYKLAGRSVAIRRDSAFVVAAGLSEGPLPGPARQAGGRGNLPSDAAAMVERMTRYLEYSFDRLDPETRRRAIAAVTPAETIAMVVHAAPEVGLPADSARARALARGAQRKQALLLQAGGALTSGEVGELLGGITVQAVKARVARRKLLSVPLSGGYLGFPAIQFDGTDVRPGLTQALAAAAESGMGAWYLFALLMDPAPGREDPVIMALEDEAVRAGFLARLATYGEQQAS